MTRSTTTLERLFTAAAAEHAARFDQEHATLAKTISQLESKWISQWTDSDKKNTVLFSDCAARTETLATAIQSHYEHVRHEADETAKKHNGQLYQLDQRMQVNQENASDTINRATLRLSSEIRDLQTRCVEAIASCESHTEAFASTLNQHRDHFTQALSELDNKHTETHATTKKRQLSIEEQLTRLQSRIQSNTETRTSDLDSALRGLAASS